MLLVGIGGRAGVGKDTAGKYLSENYNLFRYAFADPVKTAASHMFGIPLMDFYDEEKKEQINEFWEMSPRFMAQKIGTEGGRDLFRRDIWLKRAEKEIKGLKDDEYNGIVITDVRFPNEMEWISQQSGYTLLLHSSRSKKVGAKGHESESHNLFNYADSFSTFVYHNEKSFQELYEFCDWMMDTIYAEGF